MGAQAVIPEPPEPPPEPPAETPPGPPPEATPDPAPDLPPLDSIGAETDLAPWLRAGVPTALRNAAMRRKWLATPAIRDYVDPALDYAWDWNAAAAVPGAAGRIGTEAVQKMLRALTEPPPPAPTTPQAEAEAQADPEPDPATPDAPPPPPPPAAGAMAAPSEPAPRPRRHGGALPRTTG
jgi:hypothetical protein